MRKLTMVLAAAALTGCVSVEMSQAGGMKDIPIKGAAYGCNRHVLVRNTGFSILWVVPLISGDIRWNEQLREVEGGVCFFQDRTDLASVQNALQKLAERENCHLVDVVVSDGSSSNLAASYTGVALGLIGNSDLSISATLVPNGPVADTATKGAK